MNRRDALKMFTGTSIALGLEAVPEVENVERLSVNARDVLVLKLRDRSMSYEQSRRIQARAEKAFGVKVVVVDAGIDLSVIRDDETS